MALCKFGLAINRKWKDKEEVCFVDCTIFGKSAEAFNQYMAKGRAVLVEGRLTLNQWTTDDGARRSKHEVIVDNFTFLGGRGETDAAAPAAPAPDNSGAPTGDEIPF